MDGEALGFLSLFLGQRYLGVDLLAVPPDCAETLEGGTVFEACLGEERVEVVGLEWLRSLGGPGIHGLGDGDRRLREGASRVSGPLPRLLLVWAGVDRNLPPPIHVGTRNRDLNGYRSSLGED